MSGFSGGGGGAAQVRPGYVAGRWYAPAAVPSVVTGVNGQDTIRLAPMLIYQPVRVSDLGCRIGTANAGNCQLAIYASDAATKLPTGNPLAVTGNIATTPVGLTSADITGADVSFTPGLYWMACNIDGATASLQGIGATPWAPTMIGDATLTNLGASVTGVSTCYSIAQAFGAWPSLTGASLTAANNVVGPYIYFKAS